ncbi:MAG: fimbrillin family protein [Rikenellaceae bacterium]
MKKILLALSSSLLLLGACSSSEEIDGVGGSASFGDVVNFTSSVTRVENNQWEEGDLVGIFCGGYYSNKKYEVSNSGATVTPFTESETIYYVTSDELNYYAYYPYASSASGGTYNVSVANQSDLDAIDFLYANANSDEDSVNFEFEHQLAKVYFEFEVANPATQTLPESLTLALSNVGVSSTFDLANGTFSESPTVGSLTFNVSPEANTTAVTVESLMLPASSLAELKVELLYNDSWCEVDFGNLTNNSWESGKEYTCSFTTSTSTTGEVTSIVVSGATSTIYTSGTEASVALSAKVYPLNTTNTSVTWSSSDDTIARVTDEGVVWGVGAGSATITATSTANTSVSSTYNVTVIQSPLAVGDFLYADNTYDSVYRSDRTLLGVVYTLNDDGVSGTIVNVNEAKSTAWAVAGTLTTTNFNVSVHSDYTWGLYSLDGPGYALEIMQAVYAVDSKFTDSPAFTWIAALNATTVDYSAIASDATGVWFMPAEGDFKTLLPIVWADGSIINDQIAAAGGSEFGGSTVYYTTCSEVPTNAANCRNSRWNNGAVGSGGIAKTTSNDTNRIRAIMNFDLNANN